MSKRLSGEVQNKVPGKEKYPKAMVEIYPEKCKGCGICAAICPRGCLGLDQEVFNSKGFHPAGYVFRGSKGECTGCGLCYMVCPDYAIYAIKTLKKRGGLHED